MSHFYKKNLKYIGFNGTGAQFRDVIHIQDVCEIILLQIKKINRIYNETFNIGGSTSSFISLINLTKKCEKLTGNKIKFTKIKKTSLFDVPAYITDNSKLIKFYKWKPLKTIDDIINDIYNWIIENKKALNRFIQ